MEKQQIALKMHIFHTDERDISLHMENVGKIDIKCLSIQKGLRRVPGLKGLYKND